MWWSVRCVMLLTYIATRAGALTRKLGSTRGNFCYYTFVGSNRGMGAPGPDRQACFRPSGRACVARGSSGAASGQTAKNLLEQIQWHTKVIADTADFKQLCALPRVGEVTTNPSIVWQAAQQPEYFDLLQEACSAYLHMGRDGIPFMVESVPIKYAKAIHNVVPGAQVYAQLDVRAAFDTARAVERAQEMVRLADKHSIPLNRFVIKIPGSWEGIQAVAQLEKSSIRCLVTAVTSIVQAAAAAQAGASYVAPYVGRVSDWHKAQGQQFASCDDHIDPGVMLVRDIQTYYRRKGFTTKVMAASLRTVQQIKELTGCDIVTLSPKMLVELECEPSDGTLQPFHLTASGDHLPWLRDNMSESDFREGLQRDICGSSVFGKSMASFSKDILSLEGIFEFYMKDVLESRGRQ